MVYALKITYRYLVQRCSLLCIDSPTDSEELDLNSIKRLVCDENSKGDACSLKDSRPMSHMPSAEGSA